MRAADAGANKPAGAGASVAAAAGGIATWNGGAPNSWPPKRTTQSAASVATATWYGSVRLVISSTPTPVKLATQTFCVFVGSQTFCTCTTAITAATSVTGGRMPSPASTV